MDIGSKLKSGQRYPRIEKDDAYEEEEEALEI